MKYETLEKNARSTLLSISKVFYSMMRGRLENEKDEQRIFKDFIAEKRPVVIKFYQKLLDIDVSSVMPQQLSPGEESKSEVARFGANKGVPENILLTFESFCLSLDAIRYIYTVI